jgi:hypothetical protein
MPIEQQRAEGSAKSPPSFLHKLELQNGPTELLGRFFLRADAAARQRTAYLSFGGCKELVQANRDNRANWPPLVPVFDPNLGGVTNNNTFCVLARNPDGEIIAAHAARLYEWSNTNFVEETMSFRLFYPKPDVTQKTLERCTITAERARSITGRVVYSGAAWVHPDYRGRDLSSILPRVAKAYALTRWNPDFIASFMTETVYQNGFAPRFGYNNIDWEVRWQNSAAGSQRYAIVWMDMEHLIGDLREYLDRSTQQIDSLVFARRA